LTTNPDELSWAVAGHRSGLTTNPDELSWAVAGYRSGLTTNPDEPSRIKDNPLETEGYYFLK
jgi:hypothetical protein